MHAFGRRKPGGIGRGRGGFVFHRLGFKHLFAVLKRHRERVDVVHRVYRKVACDVVERFVPSFKSLAVLFRHFGFWCGRTVLHLFGLQKGFAVHKRYGITVYRPLDVNRIAVFDFGILCKRLQKVRVAIQPSGVSFFLKTERE